MRDESGAHRGQGGFSSVAGLLAMALSMALVAVLLLIGMNAFGGGTASTSSGASSSILSASSAESQLKLCAEGRDSSYGDPPTSAQQARCLNELAGEISGGSSVP